MRHHRRKKKNSVLKWVPVVVALILIVAAFIIAPSLQPPPPRTQMTTPITVNDLGRSLAETRPTEPAPLPTRPPTDAPRNDAAAASQQRPSSAGEPGEPNKSARKRRQSTSPRPSSPPAQDEAGADLNVRWNRANP
jgi:hypothetical protein